MDIHTYIAPCGRCFQACLECVGGISGVFGLPRTPKGSPRRPPAPSRAPKGPPRDPPGTSRVSQGPPKGFKGLLWGGLWGPLGLPGGPLRSKRSLGGFQRTPLGRNINLEKSLKQTVGFISIFEVRGSPGSARDLSWIALGSSQGTQRTPLGKMTCKAGGQGTAAAPWGIPGDPPRPAKGPECNWC